jgi:signal transduction histidine kinase
MRAKMQRKRAILLLAVILAPCCLLVALAARMYRQESELAEKRAVEERRSAREQARLELLNRLEKIKLQQLAASSRPAEVVFSASLEAGRVRFPWNVAAWVDVAPPAFMEALREAERREFVLRQPSEATRNYRAARALAKNPVHAAYASLSLARALEASGRSKEALDLYREILASSASDEYGIPFALYAASRLPEKSGLIFASLQREAARPCCRPLPALYLLRDLVHKSGAAQLVPPVESRIHMLEQAEALRSELPRLLQQISGPDAAWAAYGDPPWLVGLSSPSGLLAVDAGPVVSSLSGRPSVSVAGEPLGASFPGLRLAFPPQQITSAAGTLERFFFVALALMATVALLGAYLLFRDMRRELHLAEMRSQFVSSVSHELKTPLTAIRMFAENLQSRPEAAQMQSEYLDIIVNESERLSRLVDNVLDFSKIEQGSKLYSMRAVSLEEVVRTAAQAIDYPLTQKGFTLKVESQHSIETVRADADALKQAILNLLINAMKYSGPSREIGLSLSAANRQARICVSDHGVGIPLDEHQRIFERFYRVPSPENKLVSGAGLGLALVRHIAEAHGGAVEVESEPGRGSAFTIRLPLEEPV